MAPTSVFKLLGLQVYADVHAWVHYFFFLIMEEALAEVNLSLVVNNMETTRSSLQILSQEF